MFIVRMSRWARTPQGWNVPSHLWDTIDLTCTFHSYGARPRAANVYKHFITYHSWGFHRTVAQRHNRSS